MVEIASDKYKELKKEVSRLASMANKRIARLERNELTNLPAYNSWVQHGSIRFSVKGKDYHELQKEFWRVKNFLDNKTSLVRSANTVLKEMAQNTGIEYNSVKDLKTKAKQFFELANKIREYYKVSNLMAEALDYQKIWEQINTQLKEGEYELGVGIETDRILESLINRLDELTEVENNREGYRDSSGMMWDFIDL